MHLRVSTKRQGTTVYRYAQLVESFRRPSDGMPAHRVVASLGRLSEVAIANFRTAIAASQSGDAVAVVAKQPGPPPVRRVEANFDYLDIAIALKHWRQWRLGPLLDSLASEAVTRFSDVVCALVLQRCVAPGSKLYAQRWFPRTALPELLALPCPLFNNTRIHRVLNQLDQADETLQQRLAAQYAEHVGQFASVFMDVTDTWFAGRGPDLAQRGKTKEGLVARKIGIVLLCNERGYPLRWKVLDGKQQDGPIMVQMAEALKDVTWIQSTPLVCDRSLGRRCYVGRLLQQGLHFVVAIPNSEWDCYSAKIPYDAFEAIPITDMVSVTKADLDAARQAAVRAGMIHINEDTLVLDLGLIEPAKAENQPSEDKPTDMAAMTLQQRMQRCIDWNKRLSAQASLASLARENGHTKTFVNGIVQLRHLTPAIQKTILAGKAEALSFTTLRRIRRLDPTKQRQAFDTALANARPPTPTEGRPWARRPRPKPRGPGGEPLRAVLYFNPDMFVRQRQFAHQRLTDIFRFVDDLNRRLCSPSSRRKTASIHAEIGAKLKRYNLLDAFEIEVTTYPADGESRFKVTLKLIDAAWQRRRRHDGLCLLVAHPDIERSPKQLIELFHAKDAVEKDFQTIKSVTRLRPVRHRTDGKVRAHVSLCMLALLIERSIEATLNDAGCPSSAPTAFETLAPCRLNKLPTAPDAPAFYTVTEGTDEQARLLEALGAIELLDDAKVGALIVPR